MDDNEISLPDSPVPETEDLTPDEADEIAFEKQRASLQVYLDSLPYECESLEEMEEKLMHIVSKIYACTKAGDWLSLTSWDGLLQWFVTLELAVYYI